MGSSFLPGRDCRNECGEDGKELQVRQTGALVPCIDAKDQTIANRNSLPFDFVRRRLSTTEKSVTLDHHSDVRNILN